MTPTFYKAEAVERLQPADGGRPMGRRQLVRLQDVRHQVQKIFMVQG